MFSGGMHLLHMCILVFLFVTKLVESVALEPEKEAGKAMSRKVVFIAVFCRMPSLALSRICVASGGWRFQDIYDKATGASHFSGLMPQVF